jgi:hypothetical protein
MSNQSVADEALIDNGNNNNYDKDVIIPLCSQVDTPNNWCISIQTLRDAFGNGGNLIIDKSAWHTLWSIPLVKLIILIN